VSGGGATVLAPDSSDVSASAFAEMNDILRQIWSGLTEASLLDQANLVLGVIGVWLMVRQNLWAFPVGLVAVTVQAVLFFRSRFYADATLQIFFFVTLAWGWWHWVRDRGAAPQLPVTTMRGRGRMIAFGLTAAATAIWALVLARWTDAVMPWRDAFIAAGSVVAQVLQARKNLENWPAWIVVNGVAMASYWRANLAYTAFLYAIYLVMAVAGWREWDRAKRQSAHV
jgi:nicotinamide mononucleotide transporter